MKRNKTKYYKECFYGFVDLDCQRRLSRLHRTLRPSSDVEVDNPRCRPVTIQIVVLGPFALEDPGSRLQVPPGSFVIQAPSARMHGAAVGDVLQRVPPPVWEALSRVTFP